MSDSSSVSGSRSDTSIRRLITDDQDIVRVGVTMILDAQHGTEEVGEPPTGDKRWPWPAGPARTCACSTSACPRWTASRPPASPPGPTHPWKLTATAAYAGFSLHSQHAGARPATETKPGTPDADPEPAEPPEFADAAHSSTVEAGDMQEAAEVATQFAAEFMSWRYDEAPAEREARLSPLLTEHGRRWLAGGSCALAEVDDQRARREVATAELAFLEPIEANSREIDFLVAVRVTVSDTAGTETIEDGLTLTVQREDGWWAVDEMHA